jgi:phosphonate transport system substrate-binding protein
MSACRQGSGHAPGVRRFAGFSCWRSFRILAFGILFLVAVSAAADSAGPGQQTTTSVPMRFGLLPFSSPVSLFQRFAPLRDYLAEQVQAPFALESARDFSMHVQRIEAGDYDMVLTAPHFVLIALDSGHYHLVAGHRNELFATFLVGTHDPAQGLENLAGRTIATPPPEALITMVGRAHLLEHLDPDAAPPKFVAYPSHSAAIHAVTSGLAESAIASINAVSLEINQGVPVRILAESERFPGVGVLVHERVAAELRERIAEVLTTMADREDGSNVLRQMDYPGYRSTHPQEYEQFRALLPETRRHLRTVRDTP